MTTSIDPRALAERFAPLSPEDLLRWAAEEFGERVTLACSFGAEDVVLVDMISRVAPSLRAFVLDTGRLHQETYEVMEAHRRRYGINFDTYFPDTARTETLLSTKGPFSFYESIENRKECCNLRKVEPLRRALGGKEAWITGLRRAQAVTRAELPKVELDAANGGILKFNPLANWSEEDV